MIGTKAGNKGVKSARRLPNCSTLGSRAVRLLESSIRDRKVVQMPQAYFSKAARTKRAASPRLGLAFAHVTQGTTFKTSFLKMALVHRAGSSRRSSLPGGIPWAWLFLAVLYARFLKPTFRSQGRNTNSGETGFKCSAATYARHHTTPPHPATLTSPSPIGLNLKKALRFTGRQRIHGQTKVLLQICMWHRPRIDAGVLSRARAPFPVGPHKTRSA